MIAIFTNQKYFSVHVQCADRDYEVFYSGRFYSNETSAINTKKIDELYAFVVDKEFSLGNE